MSSVLVPVSYVQQYSANLQHLYQQQGSKFRGKFREQMTNARYAYFDRLGATAAVRKTVTHEDTPQIDSQHSRRRVELVDYHWADMLDKQDEIRILIEPLNAYAVNAAWAMGRAFDAEAITGFNATAKTGETGGIDVSFPTSTQQIVNGSVGLTVAKLLSAKEIMNEADVPEGGRWIAVSPAGMLDLLADPQVTSRDFYQVGALVQGSISGPYIGFNFFETTQLTLTSTTRTCWAWDSNAMGMAVGMDFTTDIGPRRDKSMAMQVYVAGSFGSVRTQDEGVVQIDITE